MKQQNKDLEFILSSLKDSEDIKDELEKNITSKYIKGINKILSHWNFYPKIISCIIKYNSISFKILNETNLINVFNNSLNQIIEYLQEEDGIFYLSTNKRYLYFDIYLSKKSVISFKETILNSNSIEFNLFYDLYRNPFFINLKENHSFLFLGNKGSGKDLSFSNFLLSFLLFRNDLNNIFLFDKENKSLKIYNNYINHLSTDDELEKCLKDILGSFENNNNNNTQVNCIFINGLENINDTILDKLIRVIKISKLINTYIVLSFSTLNDELIKLLSHIDVKIFFKLNNKDHSLKLMKNNDLINLSKNGEAIILENDKKTRVQSVYINKKDSLFLLENRKLLCK